MITMKLKYDLTGQHFGRWEVLERGDPNNSKWVCRCDCGTIREIPSSRLRSRKSESCGCMASERMTTHGKHGTPEYKVWADMKRRCRPTDNADKHHIEHHYLKGIRVCERWQSFENFIADMGERPTEKHSIDRIDNDGNYEPSNCRWATKYEQTHNRSCSKKVAL